MHFSKRIAKMEAELSKEHSQRKAEYISLRETPNNTPKWTELKLSIGRREEEIRLLETEIRELKDACSDRVAFDEDDFTFFERELPDGSTLIYTLEEQVLPDGSTVLEEVPYFPGEDS
jgi:hypothetical protein